MKELASNIQRLRKQCGYTQEQLASLLGISTGAISKWECGHASPDLALLAPLARALHTDLDTLMSFHPVLQMEEVQRMKQEIIRLYASEQYEKADCRIQELLAEYPNSDQLKLAMAAVLYMHLPFQQLDEERLKTQQKRVSHLIQEVMEDENGTMYRSAAYMYALLQLEEKNYVSCEETLNKITETVGDTAPLYLRLYLEQDRKEDARKLAQRSLLDALTKAVSSLSILAQISDDEEALRLLHSSDLLYETFRFTYRDSQHNLAVYYLKHQQFEQAANAYLAYIQSVVTMHTDFAEHPYLNALKLEYDPKAQTAMRTKMLEAEWKENRFEKLSLYPAYQEARRLIQDYRLSNEKDCDE